MASLRAGARPALRSVHTAASLSHRSSLASFAAVSYNLSPTHGRPGSSHGSFCRHQIRPFASSSNSPSQPSNAKEPLPLEGITVVSLEQAIAAPFCTRQLAELGARVIKVERRGDGDFARGYDTRVKGLASHFVWTNRSKESLELDVKDPKDFRVLSKLLRTADVLVQNLAPGASERLGLSHEVLGRENPGIIVCDISGYGSYGPYRDKKAYDLLVQSEAGMLEVTGTEAEGAKVGISVADIAAGTAAFQNILAALLKRGKTGKGCRIDISMLESMAEWMSFPMYYAYEGAPPPKRAGASHAAIYPYGPFQTGGGGSVMLGIQNEREWANLCSGVLGNADLTKDERFKNNALRSKNRDELRAIIHEAFSSMGVDEVLAKLDSNGIANAKVNDMKGLWEHPQLKARGRWTEVDTPAGKIPAMLPAGVPDEGGVKMGPVPRLGEHNEKILKELGLDVKEEGH
ncbi:Succinate--hydroxymethylglutarate CoA-transferase-like protein [Hapsidospora chrysogenum ATCC 11550]|uniref:Succinate--hydroxymethylglutarate CoA-transferase-like protein n=1 Tax=Hapsidospora chrysogenum (strain ATCC 11550 / CBS 779.69 / DSM 880 / IAM 14645 / JCM 23072 / IMI 49137) TaxID=857340 RepID=A0A086T6V9_HAPC1|nr:Succinate--hydroxymethylglutarate CoA-transferase-like protein [Hapsidospora chrysogenum ATCC 11550]